MANNILHLLFFFTLIFSCCLKKTFVYGAVEAAYHVVEMKSLAPASTCSVSTKGVHGMQIVHRYGPCSPLGRENSSPNSRQILIKDQARVGSMNSLTSNQDGFQQETMTLFGRDIGAGNYLVKAGFGTPKRDFNLIFDTGSVYTWLRCEESKGYKPSASSTSTNATCKSGPPCNFNVKYGDNSTAHGYLIRDWLTLTPVDVFHNFTFGCGLQISPDDFGFADGMLGVGQYDPLSLVSQTSNFAKIFCYCLPKSDSSTGYLLFGYEARKTCQTKTSTPLLSDPDRPDFYYVNLIGITIGNHRIDISSKTIMDSGTVITRLPSTVYSALRSEFMKFMSKYPRAKPQPERDQKQLLDTCYNLEGYGNVTLPKLVLQFAKIKVDLDPSAVIWRENRENDSQVCLAFARKDDDSDVTIIGNHQQRTLNVLYDIQENKVEFGIGGCAN